MPLACQIENTMTQPTKAAHYLKVTQDPATLALMAKYDALLDEVFASANPDRTELHCFKIHHPEIQALVWESEIPAPGEGYQGPSPA